MFYQVPPMSPEATKSILVKELGIRDLSEVFEWIDLEQPLGSASIAQVGSLELHPNVRNNSWSYYRRGSSSEESC